MRGGVVEVKGRRWWWFGCGCLGAMLVVAIWLLGDDWSKIMIERRKTAISKDHSPVNTGNSL